MTESVTCDWSDFRRSYSSRGGDTLWQPGSSTKNASNSSRYFQLKRTKWNRRKENTSKNNRRKHAEWNTAEQKRKAEEREKTAHGKIRATGQYERTCLRLITFASFSIGLKRKSSKTRTVIWARSVMTVMLTWRHVALINI